MNRVADLLDGGAHRAESGGCIPELPPTQPGESFEHLEDAVEVGLQIGIECFGRGVESLVPFFAAHFAFGKSSAAGFLLGLGIGAALVSDRTGFLELEPVGSLPRDGQAAECGIHSGTEPLKRGGAQLGVAVFNLRVEAVPEVLNQTADEIQGSAQAGKALTLEQRLSEPDRDLEILALLGERIAGQLDYERVIGGLSLMLPFSLRSIVVLAPGFFDLVVDRRVAQVLAAWILAGNRIQQIVSEGHRVEGAVIQPPR